MANPLAGTDAGFTRGDIIPGVPVNGSSQPMMQASPLIRDDPSAFDPSMPDGYPPPQSGSLHPWMERYSGPRWMGGMQSDDPSFLTDDTAAQQPFPQPPDAARTISTTSLYDAKNQEMADKWATEQRTNLAQQWGDMVRNDLQSLVQNAQQMTPSIDDIMAHVQQSGLGQAVGGAASAIGTAVDQTLPQDQPTAPATTMPPINEVAQPALDAIGQGIDQQNQMYQNIVPLDASGNIDTSPEAQQRQALATNQFTNQLGNAGAMGGISEVGPAAEAATGLAKEALTAEHPIVQKISELAGVDPEAVARRIQSPSFNPINLEKSAGRNSPVANAALAAYRSSQDASIVGAIQQQSGVEQAVINAVDAHNPGPDLQPFVDPARRQEAINALMKTKQFSSPELAGNLVDKAGTDAILGPKPITPEQQQVLSVVDELPPAAGDAVVRDAARTATGVQRVPLWQQALAERVPEAPPTSVPGMNIDQNLQPVAERAGQSRPPGPQPLPPGPGVGREPIWAHIGEGEAAPPSSTPPMPPGPTGLELPSGRNPAAGPQGGISVPAYLKNSLPGLASGTASAAAVWNQDQNDDLWRRALLTGLAFKAGSAVPYVVAGGPRAEVGARAFTAFANNLLTPGTAAVKGLTDIASVVTNPGFNFVRSLARGNGLQVAASEILPYYTSILRGNGFRDGIQGALDALNPTIALAGKGIRATSASTPSISELSSTNNLRLINAIAKFWEPIMAEAEQAGMSAAEIAGRARGLGPEGVAGVSSRVAGAISPEAITRAHSGMMMGDPEGVVGRILQPAFQAIKNMGGAGKFIEPFANIPANLIDRGISSIPGVGALNMIGAKSPSAVLARQVLGTTAYAMMRGTFETSGNGPSDPTLYQQWIKEGNVPGSVRLPGSNTWVPINKIGLLPLRGALEFDNALTDVKLNGADSNTVNKFMGSFGKSVSNELFIPQLVQLAVAATKGDFTGVPSTVGSTLRSLIPEESRLMAKAEQTIKPDTSGKPLRLAGATLADKAGAAAQAQLQANVPRGIGLPSPQPQTNVTGATVPNVQSGPSVISPMAPSSPTNDPVLNAFNGVGVPIPAAPTKLSVNGKDVELDGQQTQRFEHVRGQYLSSHMPENMSAQRATTLLGIAHQAAVSDFQKNNSASVAPL